MYHLSLPFIQCPGRFTSPSSFFWLISLGFILLFSRKWQGTMTTSKCLPLPYTLLLPLGTALRRRRRRDTKSCHRLPPPPRFIAATKVGHGRVEREGGRKREGRFSSLSSPFSSDLYCSLGANKHNFRCRVVGLGRNGGGRAR